MALSWPLHAAMPYVPGQQLRLICGSHDIDLQSFRAQRSEPLLPTKITRFEVSRLPVHAHNHNTRGGTNLGSGI